MKRTYVRRNDDQFPNRDNQIRRLSHFGVMVYSYIWFFFVHSFCSMHLPDWESCIDRLDFCNPFSVRRMRSHGIWRKIWGMHPISMQWCRWPLGNWKPSRNIDKKNFVCDRMNWWKNCWHFFAERLSRSQAATDICQRLWQMGDGGDARWCGG